MNSSQGIKGFTTFLILASIFGVGAYFLNNTYKSAIKEIQGLFAEDESSSKSKVAGKSTNTTKNYEGFGDVSAEPLEDSSGFSNSKSHTASGISGTGSVMGKSATKPNPDPLFLGLIQKKDNSVDSSEPTSTFDPNADNFTGIVTMEGILDSKMTEIIVAEFKEASIFGDLRYDFDGDEKVTSKDYPLFIEFILNSED